MGQTQSDEIKVALKPEEEDRPIQTVFTLKTVECNTVSLEKLLGVKVRFLRQAEIKNGLVSSYRLPSFPSRDGEFRVFGGRTYIAFPESFQTTDEEPETINVKSARLNYSDIEVLERTVLDGGLGPVFRCKWMGQTVTLREVYAEANENLDEILEQLCTVQHPNILRTYGYVKNGDQYYIVSQYTESSNLERLLCDPRVAWSWSMYIDIALNITDAMRCLHGHRLAHRNLKPSDILVSFPSGSISAFDGSQGEVRVHAVLANFGITPFQHKKIYQMVYKALHLPEPEDIMTPQKQFSHDVGCFGLILQRMLTRRFNWGELSSLQKEIKFICGERPELPPNCPQSITDLINWCWSRKITDRPNFDRIAFVLQRYRAEITGSVALQRFPEPHKIKPLFSSTKTFLPFGEVRLVLCQLDTGIQVRLYVEGVLILTRFVSREVAEMAANGTLSIACDSLEIFEALIPGYLTSPTTEGSTATIVVESFVHRYSKSKPRVEGIVSLNYTVGGDPPQSGIVIFGDASDEQYKPIHTMDKFVGYNSNPLLSPTQLEKFVRNAISQNLSHTEVSEFLNRILEHESILVKDGIKQSVSNGHKLSYPNLTNQLHRKLASDDRLRWKSEPPEEFRNSPGLEDQLRKKMSHEEERRSRRKSRKRSKLRIKEGGLDNDAGDEADIEGSHQIQKNNSPPARKVRHRKRRSPNRRKKTSDLVNGSEPLEIEANADDEETVEKGEGEEGEVKQSEFDLSQRPRKKSLSDGETGTKEKQRKKKIFSGSSADLKTNLLRSSAKKAKRKGSSDQSAATESTSTSLSDGEKDNLKGRNIAMSSSLQREMHLLPFAASAPGGTEIPYTSSSPYKK